MTILSIMNITTIIPIITIITIMITTIITMIITIISIIISFVIVLGESGRPSGARPSWSASPTRRCETPSSDSMRSGLK